MEKLTAKQISARAYYTANAEKIKAQKRAAYTKTSPCANSLQTPKSTKKPMKTKPQKLVLYSTPSVRNVSARERIENMRIEKQLNNDWPELM